MFVYYIMKDAGSAQDIHYYTEAAKALGHEVVLYGPPDNDLGFHCSRDIESADAVVAESDGLSVGVRLGEVEKLKRARQRRAGLRVFVGDSTAIVSTADLTADGLAELAGLACGLARSTAPDPHAGLPDRADLVASVRRWRGQRPFVRIVTDLDLLPRQVGVRSLPSVRVPGADQAELARRMAAVVGLRVPAHERPGLMRTLQQRIPDSGVAPVAVPPRHRRRRAAVAAPRGPRRGGGGGSTRSGRGCRTR